MSTSVLNNALDGDLDSLIKMTEEIINKTISVSDLSTLQNKKLTSNKYYDYLLACCYVYGPHESKIDFESAYRLIMKWANQKDNFSLYLLSLISEAVNKANVDIKQYLLKEAHRSNPLAIISLVNHLGDTPHEVNDNLNNLSSLYKQLPQQYRKEFLIQLNIQTNNKELTADNWYRLAIFYEKNGLSKEIFDSLFNALEIDGSDRYIKKIIKEIGYNNRNMIFYVSKEAEFIGKYIDIIAEKINHISDTIAKGDPSKIDYNETHDQLKKIAEYIDGITFFIKNNESDYHSEYMTKIVGDYYSIVDKYQFLLSKVDNPKKPS